MRRACCCWRRPRGAWPITLVPRRKPNVHSASHRVRRRHRRHRRREPDARNELESAARVGGRDDRTAGRRQRAPRRWDRLGGARALACSRRASFASARLRRAFVVAGLAGARAARGGKLRAAAARRRLVAASVSRSRRDLRRGRAAAAPGRTPTARSAGARRCIAVPGQRRGPGARRPDRVRRRSRGDRSSSWCSRSCSRTSRRAPPEKPTSRPVGAVGMLTQTAFAGAGVVTSLVTGGVSTATSAQACGTLYAFRAGERLGASPRAQVGAQLLGAVLGAVVVVPVYFLVVKSYGIGTEALPAPSAQSWKAMAEAVQGGALPPDTRALAAGVGLASARSSRWAGARASAASSPLPPPWEWRCSFRARTRGVDLHGRHGARDRAAPASRPDRVGRSDRGRRRHGRRVDRRRDRRAPDRHRRALSGAL